MGKVGFWRKLNAEIQFEVGLSFWTIKPVELLNILPFFLLFVEHIWLGVLLLP